MKALRIAIALAGLLLTLVAVPAAHARGPMVSIAQNATFGSILVDENGRTLYRFTRDTPNTSSACYGQCATRWPPLLVSADDLPVAGEGVDGGLLGVLTRTDGTRQVMYNGMPLYYWSEDTAAGETKGQLVGNVWYIVKPNTTTTGGQGVSVRVRPDTSFGSILTDSAGRTLYMFSRDTAGNSACYDRCASTWPPLLVGEGVTPVLDGAGGELSTIRRNDGNLQVAYNGVALYYYASDRNPGDTAGQGVNNVWWVVNPAGAAPAPSAPAAPAENVPAPAALPNTSDGSQFPAVPLMLVALLLLAVGVLGRVTKPYR